MTVKQPPPIGNRFTFYMTVKQSSRPANVSRFT